MRTMFQRIMRQAPRVPVSQLNIHTQAGATCAAACSRVQGPSVPLGAAAVAQLEAGGNRQRQRHRRAMLSDCALNHSMDASVLEKCQGVHCDQPPRAGVYTALCHHH